MSEQNPRDETRKGPMTDRQTLHLVSDTIAGPNLRLKDNLYQGLAIGVCFLLGLAIGFFATTERVMGLCIGGLAGLLVGLFGSGIFLMIFRAIKHARGQHD